MRVLSRYLRHRFAIILLFFVLGLLASIFLIKLKSMRVGSEEVMEHVNVNSQLSEQKNIVGDSDPHDQPQQFNLGLVEKALSRYHKVNFLTIDKSISVDTSSIPDWVRNFISSDATNIVAKRVVYNKNKIGYIVSYDLNGGKENYETLGKRFTQSITSGSFLTGQWAEVYGFIDFEHEKKIQGRVEWRRLRPDSYTITVQTTD